MCPKIPEVIKDAIIVLLSTQWPLCESTAANYEPIVESFVVKPDIGRGLEREVSFYYLPANKAIVRV